MDKATEILEIVKSIESKVSTIEKRQSIIDKKLSIIESKIDELCDWTQLSEKNRDFTKKAVA